MNDKLICNRYKKRLFCFSVFESLNCYITFHNFRVYKHCKIGLDSRSVVVIKIFTNNLSLVLLEHKIGFNLVRY